MSEQQRLKRRKAEAQRRMRAVERAALSCLAPGTTTMQKRQRTADRKVAQATDLTTDYLLAIAKIDKSLGTSLQTSLLPMLQAWELELDKRVTHYGDLRSLPR